MENLKQQFKSREIKVQPAEGRWPLIGAELTYPDYFNYFKDFRKWGFWTVFYVVLVIAILLTV